MPARNVATGVELLALAGGATVVAFLDESDGLLASPRGWFLAVAGAVPRPVVVGGLLLGGVVLWIGAMSTATRSVRRRRAPTSRLGARIATATASRTPGSEQVRPRTAPSFQTPIRDARICTFR